MSRVWIAVATAAALMSLNLEVALAQTASAAQPMQLAQGESGGATSGGATSGGTTSAPAATEATPPATGAEQSQELAPGPAAGPEAATFGVNPLIVGGAVIAGAVVCALVCFGNSSSTTTTSSH
jgi:hypothetical protein